MDFNVKYLRLSDFRETDLMLNVALSLCVITCVSLLITSQKNKYFHLLTQSVVTPTSTYVKAGGTVAAIQHLQSKSKAGGFLSSSTPLPG